MEIKIAILVIAVAIFIVFLVFQAYAHGFKKGRELGWYEGISMMLEDEGDDHAVR